MRTLKIIPLAFLFCVSSCLEPYCEGGQQIDIEVGFHFLIKVVDQSGRPMANYPVAIKVVKDHCGGKATIPFDKQELTNSSGEYDSMGTLTVDFKWDRDQVIITYTAVEQEYSETFTGADLMGSTRLNLVHTFTVDE